MAEAAVEQNPSVTRFYCHRCVQEVRPVLPDYICSQCQSGFIEELAESPPLSSENLGDDEDIERTFAQISDVLFRGMVPGSSSSSQTRTGSNEAGTSWRQYRPGRGQVRAVPSVTTDPRNIRAEGFLQHFIQSFTENAGFPSNTNVPVFVNLPGNPGDYVWGRGGWNAIITQLINQLDGTGPPPMPREKIDEIPTVQICQAQVDQNLQCTVCMEDFVLNEPVRLLPCQHHFHEDCIIPWLQLHGTCPICRKLLLSESGQSMYVNEASYSNSDGSGRSNLSYPPHNNPYDFNEE